MIKKRLVTIVLTVAFVYLAIAPETLAYRRCYRGWYRPAYGRSYYGYGYRPYYRGSYRPVYGRNYYGYGYRPYYHRWHRGLSPTARAALTIGAPAAVGAGIGALLGGGKGAGAGALLGGGGGALYYLITHRRHHNWHRW